jgi:hypothetical protein
MTHETTDEDRALAASLFSHPAEPDQATEFAEPATPGNYVSREGRDPGQPIPHNDARALAAALFSD